MRGRGRHIAAVLADALAARNARGPAAAAAFAEVLGWSLAREVRLRALTRDGRIIAVARNEAWAAQVRALAAEILARLNQRLGPGSASSLEVRVGAPD
ncbi:MAG TPA: DciA family protein [Anaeromyxobacteraceae bacterium]